MSMSSSLLTKKKTAISTTALIGGVTLMATALSVLVFGTHAASTTTPVNDTTFAYTGSWSTSTPATAYQSDNHFSNTANSSYRVSFMGIQAKIYAEKGPNMGIVAVSVDNGSETAIDAYSSSRIEQSPLYSSPILTPGSHTLTVRLTGKKRRVSQGIYAAADRVDVYKAVATPNPAATATPSPTPTPSASPSPTPGTSTHRRSG